jgi:hypothetical protein
MRDEYQKRASELADSIQNPRARLMFQRKADENSVTFLGDVERHALRQKTVAEAQKTDAFVSTWQDAGAKAGATGNYAEMDRAANEIDGVRRIWGQENGIPREALERAIVEDHSKLYSGAIRSMLDTGRDLDAQAAFTKYGDKLTERDRAPVERALEQGSRLGEATRLHDKIFAPSFKGVPTGGNNWTQKEVPGAQTMDEVRAETAKIKDPKTRHMVEEMARQTFADRRLADKQRNEQVFMSIAKRIEQNPGVDPQGLATPDEWENQLTDSNMKDDLKKLSGVRDMTEKATFTELIATPLPVLAGYTDAQMLSRFGSRMTKADYEKAVNRRDDARKGGPAYNAIAQYDASLMSVFVKSGLGGVKPSDTIEDIKKDDKKQAALMQFWEMVDMTRLANQHATGKKADDETTLQAANKAALLLKKNVTLLGNKDNPFDVINIWKQKKFGEVTSDEWEKREIEMPIEFVGPLFNFAKARPGTVPQGIDFASWREKDNAAINKAFRAFLAGATNDEVRAAYLGGK